MDNVAADDPSDARENLANIPKDLLIDKLSPSMIQKFLKGQALTCTSMLTTILLQRKQR